MIILYTFIFFQYEIFLATCTFISTYASSTSGWAWRAFITVDVFLSWAVTFMGGGVHNKLINTFLTSILVRALKAMWDNCT
jgi:hypothetical protein